MFTGGRGSSALLTSLLQEPRLALTLAINGYDDGASTGEVRRFLGDSLGPSDFRKNASRLARELATCPVALIEALDARLPAAVSSEEALAQARHWLALAPTLAPAVERFLEEWQATRRRFAFGDCSLGNLAFAGLFLAASRDFNRALDDYCRLVGLPPGVIENVSGGENAFLVALTGDGALLSSEAEMVASSEAHTVGDIFLLDAPLGDADRRQLETLAPAAQLSFLEARRAAVTLNPRLAASLAAADLIIYAPGTQHSSLFPSYLTPGLSDVIAANLHAVKVLITNLRADTEIPGASAVDLMERALFYMNAKGQRQLPSPCLITHYLVNEPGAQPGPTPYVPLGPIHRRDDPHTIRIANFEDGVSGRHNAKTLAPFVRPLLERGHRRRLAVVLEHARSANTTTQALVEMARAGGTPPNLDITVLYLGPALDSTFVASLPFTVTACTTDAALWDALVSGHPEFLMLFEASGMYRGDDVAALAAPLAAGELDAVWGSRRLSVRDIDESIRFRYRRSPLLGALSRAGSQALSLCCLALYGRYVSDTLSGVRAVRLADLLALPVPVTHPRINQYLLAQLLGRKADVLEVPVRFFPLSPEKVRRTTVRDGFRAMRVLLQEWLLRSRPGHRVPVLPNVHTEQHG